MDDDAIAHRPRESLDYRTPHEVIFGTSEPVVLQIWIGDFFVSDENLMRRTKLSLLASCATLMLAACATPAPSVPTATTAPSVTEASAAPAATTAQVQNVDAPVRALIEAMEAGDAARIRAQFSPRATQAYGADGPMSSPAATARWLESDIIERSGKVTNPEFSVNGNEVIVRGQYNSRGYSSKADFLFTVENGLIMSWRMRY
jgi:SnoaL-like domain